MRRDSRRAIWRWLRFLFALVAAGFVTLLGSIIWLLSGQRYQQMLTQQLSAQLGADVQVASSSLSLRNGLGIRLNTVTVQESAGVSPFFTADRIDVLLGLRSLLQGQLLFRRIECVKPRLQMTNKGRTVLGLLRDDLQEVQGKAKTAEHWFGAWLAPTLALQYLRLQGAEILYAREGARIPLVFTHADITLTYTLSEGMKAQLSGALGPDGKIGQATLSAVTPAWQNFSAIDHVEWKGEVSLSRVKIQHMGRTFGMEWPPGLLDLSGSYQGKWNGPLELTGAVRVEKGRIGELQVREGNVKLIKLFWPGPLEAPVTFPALLRGLVIESRVEDLRGAVEDVSLPLRLRGGDLTLRDGELRVTGINGTAGAKSRLTKVEGTLRAASQGPTLDLQVAADLDLEEWDALLLSDHTQTVQSGLSQWLAQPRGRALVRLEFQRVNGMALRSGGEITLQQVNVRVPRWNLDVTDLSGTVQLTNAALITDALSLKVGQSALVGQGSVHDYFTSHPKVDLRLAFPSAYDYDLALLLPQGTLLPQGGTLSGQVGVSLSAQDERVQTSGAVALRHIRLDAFDFLQPIEILEGEAEWQGQSGTFVVKHGRLPGGEFSGRGQLHTLAPLNIEFSADFADLHLESALAFDQPTTEDTSAKNTTTVVRADISCGQLTYKTMQAADLRFSCDWHGRQADVRLAEATMGSGKIRGEAVLWPDIDALFIAPQLTNVDLLRFFKTLGYPTEVLTGVLAGEGKIYMPDWHAWDSPARWDAILSLSVTNGVAKQVPILVRLWSALSLQGLLKFQLPGLPNEGLAFSSLIGDLALGKGLAVTKNLSLSSNAVQINAHGEVELARQMVNLKTALAPLYGITSSVAKVPLAGALLARSADRLTTLNFRVSGPYDDPTVTPLLVDIGEW